MDASYLALIAVQFALCVLAGDAVTGHVHWWEDAYAHLGWREPFKTQVVKPNLLHHEDQTAFLAGTWFTRCWHTLLLAGCVLFCAYTVGLLSWQLAVIAIVAALGNETHAWAHYRAPWYARMLQEMGILTTPQQHAKHHKAPYDRCYCTVTNLLNPPLDAVGFWRGLELTLCYAGVAVRRQSPERRGV